MTDVNTDHLSLRERYLMSMVYSAFLGYTKDQDHAARQVNHIVKSADELEPATTPQPSADAVRDAERWQPIESAPNGAWFLAHSERGWIGLARRADPDYAPGEGWFEDEHAEYLNPAWLTHWRPLPAPPTQDSAMQQGGGGGE